MLNITIYYKRNNKLLNLAGQKFMMNIKMLEMSTKLLK